MTIIKINTYQTTGEKMKNYLLTILIVLIIKPAMAIQSTNYGGFDSLFYNIEGKCSSPESELYFSFLAEKDFYDLKTDDQENEYKGSFDLYLLKDGTYSLVYEVHKVRDYISNGYRYDVVFDTIFEGHILKSSDKLILENLGELTILNQDGKKRSVLKFFEDRDVHIHKNMEVIFQKVSSTNSIFDEQCE